MTASIMKVKEINVRRETEKCIFYNIVDKLTEDFTLKICKSFTKPIKY